jgi:hypothetical protein
MNEEKARSILRQHGFYLQYRKRKENLYLYAKKRQGKRKLEIYICPLSKLCELGEEQLAAKLTTHFKSYPD